MLKLCIILLVTWPLFAQSYEEYLESQNQAFTSFKQKRDKEFSNFLSKEWKAYKASQTLQGYEKKKPILLPKAPEPKVPEFKNKASDKNIVSIARFESKPKVKVPKKLIFPSLDNTYVLVKYFGVDLQIHYDKSMRFSMQKSVSEDLISKQWEKLAKSKYEPSIKELKRISDRLNLNAWGEYLLIHKFSKALFHEEEEAKFFAWFILLKMGYDAHLAYQSHNLILLLPVKGKLYNTVFYTIKGKKYYAIEYYAKGKIGTIHSYDKPYEGALKEIDFSLQKLPLLPQDRVQRAYSFSFKNQKVSLPLSYDNNLLEFFKSYPQVDYATYFTSGESVLLEESMKRAFRPLLDGKSEQEALDILLNFVQNAFRYKVDEEQFKMEKVMFPSETLFYPYSDCEDRAILFSYMVKVLLNLEVVGVKYPNHMATGVKVDTPFLGEYILVKGLKYALADPSYINAGIGMSMPQFRQSRSYKIVSTGGEK